MTTRDDKKERVVVGRGRLLKDGAVSDGSLASITAVSVGNCTLLTTALYFCHPEMILQPTYADENVSVQ
jgi:hypothetical protein